MSDTSLSFTCIRAYRKNNLIDISYDITIYAAGKRSGVCDGRDIVARKRSDFALRIGRPEPIGEPLENHNVTTWANTMKCWPRLFSPLRRSEFLDLCAGKEECSEIAYNCLAQPGGHTHVWTTLS